VTQAIASADTSRNLLIVAGCGLLSGILTPLLPALLDKVAGVPADIRLALVAIPFAVLVFFVAQAAAVMTMMAFVCAVNAAIFIDGQTNGADKLMRNILSGLAGGLTGSALMALGIALLPAGPRDAVAWLRMLLTGSLAGTLLALDNALGLDQTSFLYPVWQAAVAVRLAMALRFPRPGTARKPAQNTQAQ
jgi:hypothetical protein